jgi:hypothetical protein
MVYSALATALSSWGKSVSHGRCVEKMRRDIYNKFTPLNQLHYSPYFDVL